MNISLEMKKTFKAVAENLNILEWLKEHLTGLIEIYFSSPN